MNKFNLWWKQAYAIFLLCAATAITLQAQTFTALHSFDSTEGAYPYAALVQATDGNLYGTTGSGGSFGICDIGCGTVFKITPSGTLTKVYSFCTEMFCPDGADPSAALVQANNGNFYGTTYGG